MPRASLFDRLASLADPTRSRLLFVLDRHELTVGELCAALQLPQSTVSRHLKQLGDFGLVASRAEGTSNLYRIETPLDAAAKKLWHVVRDQLSDGTAARRDLERVDAILAKRRSASEAFFSTAAGQWDALRAELFGHRADLLALPALLNPEWVVGDLGCGTGQLTEVLAPFATKIVAVDSARGMLAVARKRLAGQANVEFHQGALESLPIGDGALDVAILFLVLHYVAEPARVLSEAARALKGGGRLLVVDMLPHERSEYRERMGHVWQGFGEEQLAEWMTLGGFGPVRYRALPIDPQATGPALFAASAARKSA
jgi:ubiquinone/menaquinone biosynthesis C-methylase UbiE/DNA-binding transcriptional ArsR family regulator